MLHSAFNPAKLLQIFLYFSLDVYAILLTQLFGCTAHVCVCVRVRVRVCVCVCGKISLPLTLLPRSLWHFLTFMHDFLIKVPRYIPLPITTQTPPTRLASTLGVTRPQPSIHPSIIGHEQSGPPPHQTLIHFMSAQ